MAVREYCTPSPLFAFVRNNELRSDSGDYRKCDRLAKCVSHRFERCCSFHGETVDFGFFLPFSAEHFWAIAPRLRQHPQNPCAIL